MKNLTTMSLMIVVALLATEAKAMELELQNGYVISCSEGEGILLTAPGELVLVVGSVGTENLYTVRTAEGVVAATCSDLGFDLEMGVDHYVSHIEVADCLMPGAIRSVWVLMAEPAPPTEPVPPWQKFPWQRTGLLRPLAFVPLPDPQPPIGEFTPGDVLGVYIPIPWEPNGPIIDE